MQANLPRKHHYLPEFYTRRWADQGGHLVRYMLVPGGKVDQKRAAPGGVGFRRDLYTLPMYDEDSAQGLELGLFSHIDNYAAGALAQLDRGDIPQQNEWRTALAAFALSLQRRTPHAIEEAVRELREEMSGQFEMRPEYDDGLRLVALIRLFYIKDESPVGRAIINMEWNLIEAPPTVSLLTGDNPVLLYGGAPIPTGYRWIPTSELESFAFPISPKKLLVGRWADRDPTGLERMSPNSAAKTFNKYVVQTARSLVIAADDSHSAFVRKYLGASDSEYMGEPRNRKR